MDKYIPTNLAMTVYDIDFATLYANGARVILFDLDNTLASYDETTPTKKQLEDNGFNKKIKSFRSNEGSFYNQNANIFFLFINIFFIVSKIFIFCFIHVSIILIASQ